MKAEQLAAFRECVRLRNVLRSQERDDLDAGKNSYGYMRAIRDLQRVFFGATMEQISDRHEMSDELWRQWGRLHTAVFYWSDRQQGATR